MANKIQVIGPKLVTVINKNKSLIVDLNQDSIKLMPQKWDHGELTVSKNKLGKTIFKKKSILRKVSWVSGAVLLIDHKAFKDINGFDEKFFLYKEEEDLCLRIRKYGCSVIYNPSISIFHYGSVVAGKFDTHFLKSKLYFKHKHGNEDAV